jgi:hypothetical protein
MPAAAVEVLMYHQVDLPVREVGVQEVMLLHLREMELQILAAVVVGLTPPPRQVPVVPVSSLSLILHKYLKNYNVL